MRPTSCRHKPWHQFICFELYCLVLCSWICMKLLVTYTECFRNKSLFFIKWYKGDNYKWSQKVWWHLPRDVSCGVKAISFSKVHIKRGGRKIGFYKKINAWTDHMHEQSVQTSYEHLTGPLGCLQHCGKPSSSCASKHGRNLLGLNPEIVEGRLHGSQNKQSNAHSTLQDMTKKNKNFYTM